MLLRSFGKYSHCQHSPGRAAWLDLCSYWIVDSAKTKSDADSGIAVAPIAFGVPLA